MERIQGPAAESAAAASPAQRYTETAAETLQRPDRQTWTKLQQTIGNRAAAQLFAARPSGAALQRREAGARQAAPAATSNGARAEVPSSGMSAELRQGAEQLSGTDLSDVQVHYGSAQPAQVGALAYAQGNQIDLGPGQEQHLPHEAWHVVQQKQGRVQPTFELEASGVAVNDDPALEQEADVMGRRALSAGGLASVSSAGLAQRKQVPPMGRSGALSAPSLQMKVIQRVIAFTVFEGRKGNAEKNLAEIPDEVNVTLEPSVFFERIKSSSAVTAMRAAAIEVRKYNVASADLDILEYLKDHADGRVHDSKNNFLKTLEKDAKKSNNTSDFKRFLGGGRSKGGLIKKAKHDSNDFLSRLGFDSANSEEIYHKLALVGTKYKSSISNLVSLSEKTAAQFAGGVVNPSEIRTLFNGLIVQYTTADADKRIDQQGGFLLTVEGIIGELAGVLYASQQRLAPGERVFSGSDYEADVPVKKGGTTHVKQEVDVSYIDANNLLHLIEAAHNLNTLKNKIKGGTDSQKEKYLSLSRDAGELIHRPKAPLTPQQANHGAVSGVVFSYSIPEDEVQQALSNPGNCSVKALNMIADTLQDLVRANATLIIGLKVKKYNREEMQAMIGRLLKIIEAKQAQPSAASPPNLNTSENVSRDDRDDSKDSKDKDSKEPENSSHLEGEFE